MAKDYGRLWKTVTNTSDEADAVRTLAEILADKEGRMFISRLERKDAELCIEILDHAITRHNFKVAEKQAFFATLRRLAGLHGRLPETMIIKEDIEVSNGMIACNGFADIRAGIYKGYPVAVKTMKVAAQDNFMRIRKQFCKEVVLWSTLSHPNVIKLLGVWGDMERGQFSIVSEWMMLGNIMTFIRMRSANRLKLLHGAAQGLKYLHGAGLTHGGLKGANILMSNEVPPRACLTDFGLMSLVLDPVQPMGFSEQFDGGTITFMSPELLVPSMFGMEDSILTPEADIYAFGLVIVQVLTGEVPFRGIRQTELGFSVIQGLRPTKPGNASAIGLSDSLWSFIQRCWDSDRSLRPKVADVVTRLGEAAGNWSGVMPPHGQANDVTFDPTEDTPNLAEYRNILPPDFGDDPGSPISESFNFPSMPYNQYTRSPREEPPGLPALFEGLGLGSRGAMRPVVPYDNPTSCGFPIRDAGRPTSLPLLPASPRLSYVDPTGFSGYRAQGNQPPENSVRGYLGSVPSRPTTPQIDSSGYNAQESWLSQRTFSPPETLPHSSVFSDTFSRPSPFSNAFPPPRRSSDTFPPSVFPPSNTSSDTFSQPSPFSNTFSHSGMPSDTSPSPMVFPPSNMSSDTFPPSRVFPPSNMSSDTFPPSRVFPPSDMPSDVFPPLRVFPPSNMSSDTFSPSRVFPPSVSMDFPPPSPPSFP